MTNSEVPRWPPGRQVDHTWYLRSAIFRRCDNWGKPTRAARTIFETEMLPALASWLNSPSGRVLLEEGRRFYRTDFSRRVGKAETRLATVLRQVRELRAGLDGGMPIGDEAKELVGALESAFERGNVRVWKGVGVDTDADVTPNRPDGDIRASRPFVRRVREGRPIPSGWTSIPVGEDWADWDGEKFDLVYDPRRHEVLTVSALESDEQIEQLWSQGWEVSSTDGSSHVLTRDRLARTRAVLDRDLRPSPVDLGGMAL